jgi:hypothetical protein
MFGKGWERPGMAGNGNVNEWDSRPSSMSMNVWDSLGMSGNGNVSERDGRPWSKTMDVWEWL